MQTKRYIFATILAAIFLLNASMSKASSNGYVGFSMGPAIILAQKSLYWNTNIPSSTNIFRGVDMGNVGFLGNIHLGYGHLLGHIFYLGGEIFSEWNTALPQVKHHIISASQLYIEPYKIKIPHAYGLTARLGFQVMPYMLIYIPVGITFGRVKAADVISVVPIFLNDKRNFSSRASGRIGFGASVVLSTHVIFRLEYLYNYYATVHLPSASFLNGSSFISVIKNSFPLGTHIMDVGLDILF